MLTPLRGVGRDVVALAFQLIDSSIVFEPVHRDGSHALQEQYAPCDVSCAPAIPAPGVDVISLVGSCTARRFSDRIGPRTIRVTEIGNVFHV